MAIFFLYICTTVCAISFWTMYPCISVTVLQLSNSMLLKLTSGFMRPWCQPCALKNKACTSKSTKPVASLDMREQWYFALCGSNTRTQQRDWFTSQSYSEFDGIAQTWTYIKQSHVYLCCIRITRESKINVFQMEWKEAVRERNGIFKLLWKATQTMHWVKKKK